MKIPLTKYGMPQVAVIPAVIAAVMVLVALGAIRILPLPVVFAIEAILALALVWALSFFRDPERTCPSDENLLLSPADGKITEIEMVEGNDYFGSPALRIGIFLSIFNVHINRAPCNVKVGRITYRKGQYKNAMNPESGRVNESNELQLTRINDPEDKLIVRQISGAIARRIVCRTSDGEELAAGEKFGMIKFGSRTELYVPLEGAERDSRDEECDTRGEAEPRHTIVRKGYNMKCLVRPGDKVKAGLTPLMRYEKCPE